MAYTDITLKKLFALSGNECAFPGCHAPIVDDDSGIVVGEICHIKGKSPNGPRYDANQTDEDRNGYDNLLVMCNPHNKIVDHRQTRDQYPEERLRQFKEKHEARFKSSVVQPALLQRFINKFRELLPPITPSMIRLAVSFLRSRTERPEDEYQLKVRCSNVTESELEDFRLEIEVPSGYQLAVFEHPPTPKGRSVIQTETRVLLQVDSLGPAERTSVRVFLIVPINRYPISSQDQLRLVVRSGNQKLELNDFGLASLLDGLRNPPASYNSKGRGYEADG